MEQAAVAPRRGKFPPIPVFRSTSVTTTVYCLDGMSFLMAGTPFRGPGGDPPPALAAGDESSHDMVVLVLITARLIHLPAEKLEEAPADS